MSSDDLAGLRLVRDRAPAGMAVDRRRVRLRSLVFPPHAGGRRRRRAAGRRHALPRDQRLPGRGALCEAARAALGHTARRRSPATSRAPLRRWCTWSTSMTTPGSSGWSSTARCRSEGRARGPTARARATAWRSRRADAERYASIEQRSQDEPDARSLRPGAAEGSRADAPGQEMRRLRADALGALACARRDDRAARCASTPGAARSTPRTASNYRAAADRRGRAARRR